jgi:hypothetical protein
MLSEHAMQLIRCTGKLQKEMGLKKAELWEVEPKFSYLGSWHANLIYIGGRKCILFVNDKTLFNFLAPGVSRAEIKNLSVLFKSYLPCVLSDAGFGTSAVEKIMSEYDEISYAKTKSKSVLGSMNDLAFHYKYHIQDAGGVHSYEVPSIIRRLNKMPMGAIKYAYPLDTLRTMYEPAT